MKKILFLLTSVVLSTAVTVDAAFADVTWTVVSAPTQTTITGGPWTLGQGPTSSAFPTKGYCVNGVLQNNPGTNLFQPYYFPLVIGQGLNLQGYFDYRPKDTNEAIVAASSSDGGQTWSFQQKVLELNPNLCPTSDSVTNAQSYPNSGTNYGLNSGNDAGEGHPAVINFKGTNYLYTLDRTLPSAQVKGLVVHTLSPTTGKPLNPTPANFDGNTTGSSAEPTRTTGLLNPDGIIGDVPGTSPRVVMYLQKQLAADNTGTTAFPTNQVCASPPTGASQAGKKANHDITTPRLASTTDGINFKDLGSVTGLNDSKSVSWTGTRYVGPRGTLFRLPNNRYGLFFSGGNCLDADSDAFHYIGYAESSNLRSWTVINGINNPIASVQGITVASNDSATSGQNINIPANAPLFATQPWFAQRVYSPSATLLGNNQVSLIFAGYNTKSPSDNPASYRTISRVILNSSLPLLNF